MTQTSSNHWAGIRILSFFVLTILFFPQAILAQVSQSGSSSGSFDLSNSTDLGIYYFQDPTGIQVATSSLQFEGTIDKSTYRIGTNDLITVEIKGTQAFIFRGILVNGTGDIILPSLGIINLKGLTILEAEEELENTLTDKFIDPDVKISIELPRNINVHVSGSIPFPGRYQLPSQSRVDLAIYQSVIEIESTPTETQVGVIPIYTSTLLEEKDYSFRNIRIEHADGTTSNADLIRYFRTGDLQNNPLLRDGDRIKLERISENTPQVSISGAVRYGYTLEFKRGETIQDLLEIAGWFEENADSSKALIIKQAEQDISQIEVLRNQWRSYQLDANSRVVILEKNEERTNASSTIKGEVVIPGNYPIITGETTVADLLEFSGHLTKHALPKAAYLIRGTTMDNEIPNKYSPQVMSRTSDQYQEGLDYLEMETRLSKDRVHIDLTKPLEMENVFLFDGDYLFVPRNENTIFVFGQVNNPGYFPFLQSNITVSDYIQRAGGLSLSADEKRIFIIKAGSGSWFKPSDTELESGDRIFVDRIPLDNFQAARAYDIQREQLKNQRIQLIMTGLTTITSVITTLVAIDVIK